MSDENKVMDVSRPGKGKIMSTSRPIVAPVVSDVPKAENVSPSVPNKEDPEPLAQSAGHKVIQPLSPADETSEIATAPAPVEDDTAAQKPAEPENIVPARPAPEPSESSGAAEVDALAGAAEAKKLAAKEAEEQAKRDAALQELIDSKKYFVKTSHGAKSGGSSGWLLTGVILVLALVVGGYLLIDSGVINVGIKLPFDLIK